MGLKADGSLIFDTRVDTDGFEKGSNTIKKQASGLKNAISGLGVFVGIAFGVKQLYNLGKQAVETASDLAEVQNVVDTAFGSMSGKIENFSKTCIDMYGISELTAKQTASTFMAMGSGMDLAAGKASDMAVDLTARMGDMMSFYNQTADVVSTALNGIYTGETESLKKFGVVMTEANLQAYALQNGINKSVSAMSQAEKVTLRYNYVMEKTALSQGDFARTSDGWANSTRVLKEEFKALLAQVGNGLMQSLIPALRVVNAVLQALVSLANTVSSIFSDIFGFQKSVYSVSSSTADVTDAAVGDVSNLGDAVTDAGKQISKGLAPFDQLNQVTEDLANNASNASDSSAGLGGIGSGLEEISKGAANGSNINDEIKEANKGLEGLKLAIVGIGTVLATYAVVEGFIKLGAAVAAFTSSPVGIVALAVGGLAMLGVGLYDLWKNTKEHDLAERFGDITLSAQELKDTAQAIVDNGSLEKIRQITEEWGDLKPVKDDITASVKELNKLNWKVSLGMELTAEDEEKYKTAINTYINKVQSYIQEQKEAVILSMDVLLSGDEKADLIKNTQNFYDGVSAELASLGKELNDVVTLAWQDGLLTIDETEKIQQIQGQMQSIMNKIAVSEYNAKLEMIKVKFSGVELTPETYKNLENEINETVQNYTDQYDLSVEKTVAALNIQLSKGNISTKEYDKAIADIKKTRLQNIGTIRLNATRFSIGTLTDAFKKEIETRIPGMKDALIKSLNTIFTKENADLLNGEQFFQQIAVLMGQQFDELDGAAKSNMEDLLEFLKPSKKQLESLAKESYDDGKIVPENIVDGLSAIYQMEALTGNSDAIYKLIGMAVANSPEKIKLINNMKKEGKKIPAAFDEGVKLGYGLPAETVQVLFKKIGITTTEQQKILNGLMEGAGKSAVDKLTNNLDKSSGPVNAIKGVLSKVSSAIKNYVFPEVTFSGTGGTIGKWKTSATVSKYASGTVVPANYGEFLGILGDNKKETEVVSPLSTIKQALVEALRESGGTNSNSNAHYTINMNGRAILEGIVEADNERAQITGEYLLNQ